MTDTNFKILSYYTNKIHNNPEFYEAEKKRVAIFLQNIRLKDIRMMKNINKRKKNTVN